MPTSRWRRTLSERPSCCLSSLEVILLAVEARLGAAQLADHDRLAVAQDRDLAGELVDLGVVVGELAREDALLVLLLVELGLALVELGLQVLGAGAATEREQRSAASRVAAPTSERRGAVRACACRRRLRIGCASDAGRRAGHPTVRRRR